MLFHFLLRFLFDHYFNTNMERCKDFRHLLGISPIKTLVAISYQCLHHSKMLTHTENTSTNSSLNSQATPTENGFINKAEIIRNTVSSLRTYQ